MNCYILSRNHPQRMSEQRGWPLHTPQTGQIEQQRLGAGEPTIKVLANSVCGENPLLGLQTAVFLLCPHTMGRKRSLVSSSSHNGTNYIMGAPPPMTTSKPHHLSKAPLPSTITWGVRTSTDELQAGEGTNIRSLAEGMFSNPLPLHKDFV